MSTYAQTMQPAQSARASEPRPTDPRGMSRHDRIYLDGWTDGARAMMAAVLRWGAVKEVSQAMQAILDAGPHAESSQ